MPTPRAAAAALAAGAEAHTRASKSTMRQSELKSRRQTVSPVIKNNKMIDSILLERMSNIAKKGLNFEQT